MKTRNLVFVGALLAVAAMGQAVTFTNIIVQSPPLSNGATWNFPSSNDISFFLPNAIVGDASPTRFGTLNIQYDACDTNGMFADTVTVNLATAILGSGTIVFNEQVFELDANGNEVGPALGNITHVFDSSSSMTWSDVIELSDTVTCMRVKKSFTLSAVDTQAVDVAGIAIVNQSIHTVPEPASMIALGLGAAALIRRRKR